MSDPEADFSAADHLLDSSDPESALEHTLCGQKKLLELPGSNLVLLGKLAGLLIDCGSDLGRPELVEEGLGILESRFDELKLEIQEASLHYNIGNAKKALHNLEGKHAQRRFNPAAIVLLTDAKNAYWRAYRLSKTPDPQLIVNLANCLDGSCRVVEALRHFDTALAVAPGFPMAQLNRGLALLLLNQLSSSYSIKLLAEAVKSFRSAETSKLPPHLLEVARQNRSHLSDVIRGLGLSLEQVEADDHQDELEADAHDPYWKFCLDNYLALSEHSLYCRCAGARRDDLSIPKSSGPIGGDFVPRLELFLNRLKSEFCLARALYYNATTHGHWGLDSFEGTFSELYEGEAIGIAPESLRTSFRLCFGILDRIALGLSELYNLTKPEEALYFDSFWRPAHERNRGEERWTKINQQNNWGLVALYSIATDLNANAGEWGFFKKHRNSLEHGLLVLTRGDSAVPPLARPERMILVESSLSTFNENTLHMLQLTASAIFSFVFCVRTEGLRELTNGPADQMVMGKKDIGKE